MRWHFVRAALCGAVLLAACDNDSQPLEPDDAGGATGTLSAPRAVARFGVDVRAAGSFRPGQPIQITVNARGLLRTSDAEVRLVLPEVAALREGGGGRMHVHPGQAPGAEMRERMPLGRGQAVTRTASITISQPGYYQVIASVEQKSENAADEQDAEGLLTNNVEHDIIWLWISENGGAATDDFEPTRIPAGMHVAPGPLTPQTQPAPGTSGEAATGTGPAPRPSLGGARASHTGYAGWVDIHAGYSNPDAGGAFQAIPNARYEFYIYTAAGAYVETRTGTTDAQGLGFTQCYQDATGAYGSYRFRVFLDNDRLTMSVPMAIDATGWFSSQCGTVVYAQTTTEANRMSAHVYTNLDRDIRYSDSFFGTGRPDITVRVEAAAYSTFDWNTTYQLIIDTTTDAVYTTSQVWGEYGQFVQAHEYGHAFQYFLEPTVKQSYYYDCPNPHYINTSTTHGCALAEGFPDYYAVTVAGTYTGSYRTNIENGAYSPATAGNGSKTEGAVASFLYDMTDPANETHDQTAYSGVYVAEVLRTCEALIGTTWVHQRGIDHLVYCFMNQVVDASQFNRTNGNVASGAREGATEPESLTTLRTKVRKNYEKNLFGTTV